MSLKSELGFLGNLRLCVRDFGLSMISPQTTASREFCRENGHRANAALCLLEHENRKIMRLEGNSLPVDFVVEKY